MSWPRPSIQSLLHVDGGLINVENASHVIVAIQALMHCTPFVYTICTDEDHMLHCKTLMKCLSCSLVRLQHDLFKNKISDPTNCIKRWNVISQYMPLEKQLDPFTVLTVFINVLRLESSARKPEYTHDDMLNNCISKIWLIEMSRQVSCPLCGVFMIETTSLNGIEIQVECVSDLEKSANAHILGGREVCSRCGKNECDIRAVDVKLPKCVIINVKRCNAEFQLPIQIEVMGAPLKLNSLIVKPNNGKEPCFIITSCPNYYFRRFDDSKISVVSPISLSNEKFLYTSQLTFLYLKKNTQLQVLSDNKNSKDSSNIKDLHRLKIVSYPKLHDSDPDDPPEITTPISPPKQKKSISRKTVSTQTYPLIVCHVGVQTLPVYCYEVCKHNPKFKLYTGLEVNDFDALFELIGGDDVISRLKRKYALNSPEKLRPGKLTSEDKLLMFLMRLRRGLPLLELSEMFRISISTVGELCYVMTRLLYTTFKSMEDDMFPSAAQQRAGKPPQMKPFKNLRIILDGVSFFVESPSNFQQQGNMYSKYKTHSVIVFSVGISCRGATIFCSGGMEGSMSDKAVILNSNLLERLDKGDGVMTDRGYELTTELQAKGCQLFKPPSLGDRDCFTPEEEIMTKALASARIYTEHANGEIKDNRLLQGTIPLLLLPVLGNLVYIAAYLRNFCPVRIKNKKIVCETNSHLDYRLGI